MKRFIIAISVSLFLASGLISCSGNEESGNDGGKFDVQFNVPSSVTLEKDASTMDFKVLFKKAPMKTDIVVFDDPAGVSHDCAILNVSESEFTVALYDGMYSGLYGVNVKRGKQVKKMGEMNVTVDTGSPVKPENGSTVYGVVSCAGKPLKDVVVSDGVEVTSTNADGIYQLKSAKKYGYVFISIPSGYEVSNDGILPRNYIKLAKEAKVAERVDFQVFEAGDQTNHTILVFGDMHLANRNNDKKQFYEFIDDVNAYTDAHKPDKVYAVTLGDMTWDYYWYSNTYQFSQYLYDASGLKNLTVYHTIGNHDHDMNSVGDFDTIKQYMDLVAPDYYSFNIGKVHYVVLDDIECTNNGGGRDYRTYNCKVTDEQLDWLKKDLSYVSKSTPVVLTMHATTTNMNAAERQKLVNAVSGFDQVHFLTGHTHKVGNTLSGNYFDHNSGAVCAAWWWSGYYYPGIHIGQDGACGGYQIFNIAGDDFKWQYKPTGKSSDIQFRTYDRNTIELSAEKYMPSAGQTYKDAFNALAKDWVSPSSANEVYINVWNYDPQWKIEVTENGKTLSTERVSVVDPLYILTYSTKAMEKNTKPTFNPGTTSHVWKVTASAANTPLEIKVTDRFGNVYTETMSRPKAFNADTYR